MQWFNNLQALPKLVLSFGLLTLLNALTGVIALERLNSQSDQVVAAYSRDIEGMSQVDSIARSGPDSAATDATAASAANSEPERATGRAVRQTTRQVSFFVKCRCWMSVASKRSGRRSKTQAGLTLVELIVAFSI